MFACLRLRIAVGVILTRKFSCRSEAAPGQALVQQIQANVPDTQKNATPDTATRECSGPLHHDEAAGQFPPEPVRRGLPPRLIQFGGIDLRQFDPMLAATHVENQAVAVEHMNDPPGKLTIACRCRRT